MNLEITNLQGDSGSLNQARVAEVQKLADQCTAEVPFLLVPVRLEARFVTVEEPVPTLQPIQPFEPTLTLDRPLRPITAPTRPGQTHLVPQLRVRIFPDDISVLTHEPELTAAERDAGIAHWREVAAGGADEAAARAAWRALCVRLGPPRAAWVAGQTQPAKPVTADPDVAQALARLGDLHAMLDRLVADARGLTNRYPDITDLVDRATPKVRSLPGSGLGRVRESGATADHKLDALAAVAHARKDDAAWKTVTRAQENLRAAVAAIVARPADPVPGEVVIDDAKLKAAAWTRPARAGALPQRFVVVTVSSGQISHVVAGNDIPADLSLGLDPRAENIEAETPHVDERGNLEVGASLRWLVDYDTARDVGMAINVPITAAEAVTGFDRIYVLGLASGADPDAAAATAAALLDDHHYTAGGLSLVPIGTPTNNTDAGTSGHHGREDAESSFDIERGAPLVSSTVEPTDGARLARGLGLPAAVVAHVAHADGHDIADARVATAALWPATAGYALEEQLGRLISLNTRDRLRVFATEHVLGRGALPTMRVGDQPYGVLTTTAFGRFEPAAPMTDPQGRFEALLRDVLLTMRDDWSAQLSRVAHAHGAQPSDPRQRVLAVLGLDATGRERRVHVAVNSGRPGSSLHTSPFALVERFAGVIAKANGFPPGPAVSHGVVTPAYAAVFEQADRSRPYEMHDLGVDFPLRVPTMPDDLPSMVDSLLATSIDALARMDLPIRQGRPLLFALLRQALLVQARDVALRILAIEGTIDSDLRAQIGSGGMYLLSGLGTWQRRVTRWTYLLGRLNWLDGALPGTYDPDPATLYGYLSAHGNQPMHAFLNNRGDNPLANGFSGTHAAEHRRLMAPMRGHAEAVRQLGALPRSRAEAVTVEHLDVCSHRLDAWLLGLANSRLAQLRANRLTGLHLGAFGWLEDLRPAPATKPATDVPKALVTDRPVYEGTLDGGFIHAPSADHAAAAALLRAGFVTRSSNGTDLSVNVSSRRVRSALALLDGITAGNDLGALLGYQFERDLHDEADHSGVFLDELIAPLRARFPSVAAVDSGTGDARLGERQVVDGVSLLATVRAAVNAPAGTRLLPLLRQGRYAAYPYGVVDGTNALLPPTSAPQRLDPVLAALDRLADTIDAVSDLVLTEGVYQIVRGNHPRAAAVLSALGEGRTPVQPEVVDTPVTGSLVSHRVLVHLVPGAPRPHDWTAPSARADAEPALNHWLGELIGPPGQTRVQVVTDDNASTHVADVSLTALEVQPIDLLAALYNGFDAALTELTVRVLDTLRPLDVRENEPAPGLRLELARHPDWPDTVRCLADTAALLEVAAQMLGRARAANPSDYRLAEEVTAPSPAADVGELAGRVGAAVAALQALGVRLLRLLSDGADSDPALLAGDMSAYIESRADVYRDGAAAGAHLGRLDVLWARRHDFREALLAALGFGITGVRLPTRWVSRDQVATAWLEAAESALVEVAERLSRAHAAGGSDVATLLDTARAVFTDTTPVLPWFHLANSDELAQALLAQETVNPAVAASGWLAGVAPVRENIAALTTITALAGAFGRPAPVAVPVQLPAHAGEAWSASSIPDGSRLSLLLVDPAKVATDGSPCVALRIDGWDELVPSGSQTTGITFQYDQPASTPPQCLLLAVPPRTQGSWRWEDLVQTVHETFELAKLRAVEPEHLQDGLYGELLPALIDEPIFELDVTAPHGEGEPQPPAKPGNVISRLFATLRGSRP